MTTHVIGLIQLRDSSAFEIYRAQVGATVEAFGGRIHFRGELCALPWNELHCDPFDAVVDIVFPDESSARAWSTSPAYQQLIDIRSKAMKLTLFLAK